MLLSFIYLCRYIDVHCISLLTCSGAAWQQNIGVHQLLFGGKSISTRWHCVWECCESSYRCVTLFDRFTLSIRTRRRAAVPTDVDTDTVRHARILQRAVAGLQRCRSDGRGETRRCGHTAAHDGGRSWLHAVAGNIAQCGCGECSRAAGAPGPQFLEPAVCVKWKNCTWCVQQWLVKYGRNAATEKIWT